MLGLSLAKYEYMNQLVKVRDTGIAKLSNKNSSCKSVRFLVTVGKNS